MEPVKWVDEFGDKGRLYNQGEQGDGNVVLKLRCGEHEVTHLLDAETARKIAVALIAGADWLEVK